MGLWKNSRSKSKDPKARRKALEKLDAKGNADGLGQLAAGLADENVQVRCAAVKGLSGINNELSVTWLVRALLDSSADVRQSAADALGHMGDARACGPLSHLLKDPRAQVRASATVALRNLQWTPGSTEQQALWQVASGDRQGAPGGDRQGAAVAAQAVVKELVSGLLQDTSFKRRAAAEALQDVNDPDAIQPLLEAAGDTDATVRVSAIHGLARDCSLPVTAKLLFLFRDVDPNVRLASAQVLAKRQDPSFATDFISLLGDSHFEVRLTAVQFLGRIMDPQFAEAMLPLLADTDSDVRHAVVLALGSIGNPVAIEALVLALTDEERVVRQGAEASLEKIDPHWISTEAARRASVRLEMLLNERPPWVRTSIMQVLAKLGVPAGGGQPG